LLKWRRLILEEWELVEAAYDQDAKPEENGNLVDVENCFNSRRDKQLRIVEDMVDEVSGYTIVKARLINGQGMALIVEQIQEQS
jgi:hypothetical protein